MSTEPTSFTDNHIQASFEPSLDSFDAFVADLHLPSLDWFDIYTFGENLMNNNTMSSQSVLMPNHSYQYDDSLVLSLDDLLAQDSWEFDTEKVDNTSMLVNNSNSDNNSIHHDEDDEGYHMSSIMMKDFLSTGTDVSHQTLSLTELTNESVLVRPQDVNGMFAQAAFTSNNVSMPISESIADKLDREFSPTSGMPGLTDAPESPSSWEMDSDPSTPSSSSSPSSPSSSASSTTATKKISKADVYNKSGAEWVKDLERSPSDKLFRCPIGSCPYKSHKRYNLGTHIDSKHANAKPFHCEQCDKDFSRKFDMQRHVVAVHSIKVSRIRIPKAKRDRRSSEGLSDIEVDEYESDEPPRRKTRSMAKARAY
ncbi:hypothetical protein SmJEL517_g04630 [Synchytrium microbalum]|uniref:C2H2-type domain-containing protein n=1 Tax=Synchytrium microbalum TaxID=1806994 RepID=A0A507C3U0_9FUNG|nr:uncharacterized protein SmJEL517_g04630 [Synchytrium microbalum]TPX32235.1 hypothetical protein SmJEL517_g04630 [Synchytrium microbalum]